MKNQWFRFYSDFIHNETVEFLSFDDQRHYVFVLCMKNLGILDKRYPKSDMLEKVVGRKLGLQCEALTNTKARLIDVGLIDENWQPSGWEERQFISDSKDPTAAERMRRHRDKKSEYRNDTVTLRSPEADTDTDTDTETDTETETETETDTETDMRREIEKEREKGKGTQLATVAQSAPHHNSKKGTRLDPSITLSDDWFREASQITANIGVQIDIELTFDQFRDYWISKTQDATKLNWLATWRNWVRTDAQKAQRAPRKFQGKMGFEEAAMITFKNCEDFLK